jgi:hypothetical protein
MATNGSIGGENGRMAEAVGHSCQSIPKRFGAFRNKALGRCHLLRFVAD